MECEWRKTALKDYCDWKKNDPNVVRRIDKLITETSILGNWQTWTIARRS